MTPAEKEAMVLAGGIALAGVAAYFLWPQTPVLLTTPLTPQPVMIDVSGPVSQAVPGISYVFTSVTNGLTKAALITQLQAAGWTSTIDTSQPPSILYFPGTQAANYTDADPAANWPSDLPYPSAANFQQQYFAAAGMFNGTAAATLPAGSITMQYVPVTQVAPSVSPVPYGSQLVWIASGGGLFVANYGLCGSPQKAIAVGLTQDEVILKASTAISASCAQPAV